MEVSKRVKRIKASGIREIFEAKQKNKKLLDFSLGQPDFDVSSAVKQAAVKAIRAGNNKYTENQGILELRQAIAKKLKTKNRIESKPDEVIITAGVTGGLALSFFSLLNPGDEIIVPDPCFVLYQELPKLLGIKVVSLDTYPDFQFDINKLNKLITAKTKAVIINTPNAPTGQVYSKQTLIALAQVARKHNLIIISDEIYEDFIYDNVRHFSIGSIYQNTITLNGFSKSFGMPGWRIGYLHAPKKIITEMIKLQQLLYCCAPSIAQHAAITALCDRNYADKIKKQYQRKRDLIYSGLKNKFNLIKPAGSFYAFITAPGGDGTEFCKRALKANVALVPGGVFSQHNTHFRLAFCVGDEIIKKGVGRLLEL